jgi:hypothetical protein
LFRKYIYSKRNQEDETGKANKKEQVSLLLVNPVLNTSNLTIPYFQCFASFKTRQTMIIDFDLA